MKLVWMGHVQLRLDRHTIIMVTAYRPAVPVNTCACEWMWKTSPWLPTWPQMPSWTLPSDLWKTHAEKSAWTVKCWRSRPSPCGLWNQDDNHQKEGAARRWRRQPSEREGTARRRRWQPSEREGTARRRRWQLSDREGTARRRRRQPSEREGTARRRRRQPSEREGTARRRRRQPSEREGTARRRRRQPSEREGTARRWRRQPSEREGTARRWRRQPSEREGTARRWRRQPSEREGTARRWRCRKSNGEVAQCKSLGRWHFVGHENIHRTVTMLLFLLGIGVKICTAANRKAEMQEKQQRCGILLGLKMFTPKMSQCWGVHRLQGS